MEWQHTAPFPEQSVLVFKAKFVNLQPAEPSLQLGRALILKPVCTTVAALDGGTADAYGCMEDERRSLWERQT